MWQLPGIEGKVFSNQSQLQELREWCLLGWNRYRSWNPACHGWSPFRVEGSRRLEDRNCYIWLASQCVPGCSQRCDCFWNLVIHSSRDVRRLESRLHGWPPGKPAYGHCCNMQTVRVPWQNQDFSFFWWGCDFSPLVSSQSPNGPCPTWLACQRVSVDQAKPAEQTSDECRKLGWQKRLPRVGLQVQRMPCEDPSVLDRIAIPDICRYSPNRFLSWTARFSDCNGVGYNLRSL